MKFTSLQKRVSFQVKVLAPVLTVMALLMVATILLVNRRLKEQMHENAASQLDAAAAMFTQTHERQTEALLNLYRNIRHEPRFKAVTRLTRLDKSVEYDTNAVQLTVAQTIGDYMQEMVNGNQLSVASLTLLNDPAHPLFRSGTIEINTNQFRLRSAESVRQAAPGEAKADTICVDTNLFDIVSVPVGVNDEITCVLTLGLRLGSKEAGDTRQFGKTEIILLADGKVAASSLVRPDLFPIFVARFNALNSPTSRDSDASADLLLQDQHYLCRAGHFISLSGGSSAGYLLLSSYEKEWRTMRDMQSLLLTIGLLGMGVGGVIVWYLIRRATQPLRELRDQAEAVGRGDFSKRVDISSHDECGELAGAFNHMTENLKTSREQLEKTVETLKATQHQLIQSEKLAGIGEFVAGVAHELNNPLTTVMGFSELMQQLDVPDQHRRYLDMVFKSAKRCQKIVQSLLSFARRHAPERKVSSVNQIVESSVELMHYQMRTSNIEVVTELDPQLPAVELDPHQMQQVFLNIINNARQAMEGRAVKGRLSIATSLVGNRVHIRFQDNGPGITPENLKRIFNPFFTTKEVGQGTGLGLSLCYGIVGEHGGTITPFSEPGQGATFVIELPAAERNASVEDKDANANLPATSNEGAGRRVLVVDDEEMISQMIREVLTRHGYEVDIVHDGETALNRLKQKNYDLTLCDWKMPGLNGRQVYEKLSASNPEMARRLLFITGDIVNEKAQEFLRTENKICLPKPFTLGEFRSALKQVLSSN